MPGQRLTIAQALHGLYPLLVPSWAASKVDALQHLASRPGIAHMCLRSLMQGIRRSMNLPDWEIVAPESNPNPFFDTLAPSVAPRRQEQDAGAPPPSPTHHHAGAQQACWRWHLDCADPETGAWGCLLSDRDLFVALRSMLRRSTRVPPRGAAAAPFAQASGSAAGASSHPAVPPLGGAGAIDARLARTQRRSGLDLRLRVVVGQRCLHPEPLPPPEATGIGKVISTFLNATAPTIPSHMPAFRGQGSSTMLRTNSGGSSALRNGGDGGPGFRRVFLSAAPPSDARDSGFASPGLEDLYSPEVLLVPAARLLDTVPVRRGAAGVARVCLPA